MATSDADTVPAAPAPWDLHAVGYILMLRLDAAQLEPFVPDELRALRVPGFSYAMFVDYAEAPVGPYHELLFIPGAFRYPQRTCFTVTKIYVSTLSSVVNGRRNWGIPKEQAQFEVSYGDDRVDRVRMRVEGRDAVELSLRHYLIGFPLVSGIIPSGLRTLCQTLDGKRFTIAPSARSPMRAARLLAARSDGRAFPAFTPANVVVAVKLPRVQMTFPVAEIETLPAG